MALGFGRRETNSQAPVIDQRVILRLDGVYPSSSIWGVQCASKRTGITIRAVDTNADDDHHKIPGGRLVQVDLRCCTASG